MSRFTYLQVFPPYETDLVCVGMACQNHRRLINVEEEILQSTCVLHAAFVCHVSKSGHVCEVQCVYFETRSAVVCNKRRKHGGIAAAFCVTNMQVDVECA